MTHRFFGSAQRTLLALSTALLVFAGPAGADEIGFDDINTSGGDISFSGNAGDPLVGSDVIFDFVTGPGTPGTDLFCGDCLLDFTTGGLVLVVGDVHIFGGGGSYVLTGTLFDNPGLAGLPIASGVLLTGTWTQAVATLDVPGQTVIVSGNGTDTKNADLVSYYGIAGLDFLFSQTEISGQTGTSISDPDPGEGGARSFSAVTINADLNNFPGAAAIPEPTTLLLLGSGLAGLGLWRRRSSQRP